MPNKQNKEQKGVTDAQKRATRTYMQKYCEVKVRMTPERRSEVQEHATSLEESTTAFINRAIDETTERDKKKKKK